jgi:outer membrane murein-binding lipoprotein Lpp
LTDPHPDRLATQLAQAQVDRLSQQVQQLQAQVATLTAERDAWRDRAGQVALQAAVARLEAIQSPGARDTSPRKGDEP